MLRQYRLRYLFTFLISVALTFHFLQSRTNGKFDNGISLSQKNVPSAPLEVRWKEKAGYKVLSGNVTVHIGEDRTSLKIQYVKNPTTLCNDFNNSGTKLLIIVVSSVQNAGRRRAIRDTWGLKALQEALNFRLVFLLGNVTKDSLKEDVAMENVRYGDIIETEINDTFGNLGLKTVAGLKWSKLHCAKAEFVMKTDDDILVHVPNLFRALRAEDEKQNLLLCHENRMRRILRKDLMDDVPKGYAKYQVPETELPGIFYPPYCSGMAYVFSRAVRDRLWMATLVTPVFFIEDVYLTGFCRQKAGITITPHAGITLRPPLTAAQAACMAQEWRITSHEVTEDELRSLWSEVNTQGFFCPKVVGYGHRMIFRSNSNTAGQDAT